MIATQSELLADSFLNFASEASNILHIKSEKDYNDALEEIEYLFSKVDDSEDDPLHDLIELISKAVEKYESNQEEIISFCKAANAINQESSVLRVLMNQHGLNLSGFKDEIGSKSLVSMILNGKRNLTKEHISKLSKRFNLNPILFFSL